VLTFYKPPVKDSIAPRQVNSRAKPSPVLYNYFMQFIPKTTQPFFQEYEFQRLDLERDGDLIIVRLLAFGNRDQVRWLLLHDGRDNI
jgi:hypothetical protein